MALVDRIACGAEYLAALGTPRWSTWREGFYEFQKGALGPREALTLAHPQWRAGSAIDMDVIQGPRNFEATSISPGDACEAQIIWGYPCPLPASLPRHQDHMFPYGLGGPTVVTNRLTLCSVHNQVKAFDVHLYPWENGAPAWLADTLDRINRYLV